MNTSCSSEAFRARVDKVRERVDIVALIAGAGVKLGNGSKPRGQCPFHQSKSDSFAVYPDGDTPYARCWGCPWHGDAIKFVQDFYNVPFIDALKRLEEDNGLDGLQASPVHRERSPHRRRAPSREMVDSATFGRTVWEAGTRDFDAIRTYFMARKVPAEWLTEERLRDFRFARLAPISAWAVDKKPGSVPQAPTIALLIRRPVALPDDPDQRPWRPIGIHLTFLSPDLTGKMERKRWDGEDYEARKMCGSAMGGCAVLGRYRPDVALFNGEGTETTFSGMDFCRAPEDACGLAMLSLDNLTGKWATLKGGVTPLYDIRPTPTGARALTFAHDGPVTGLIDADMKPLLGTIDRVTGQPLGMPVIERRGGPVVRRAITTGERAMIAAELLVKSWRAAGVRRVTAARPPMGMDFNDLGRMG